MRRASLALSILSLLFVFAVAPLGAYAQTSAGIFSESGYDFKGIPRNTMPRHSFIFTNNSKEDLQLLAARVSCQCTKVFIPEKRVYKPGEKGEVVAQIDGVRFTGVRHVTLTVTFQRGSSVFEIPLNITGVIIENVSLTPQKLTFLVDQDVKPSEAEENDKPLQLNTNASTRTQKVRVSYPGYNETVSRVACSSPSLEVKVGQPVRTNYGTETPLFVTVKNDAPAGYIDASVQIWSNGPNGGTPLLLNVSGVIRAPLSVSPGTLTFPTVEDGQKVTKNFVVTAPSEFTLKSVQSPVHAIECKFSPKAVRPAKVCVVPVTFDPAKLDNATENSKLKIETTDGRVLFLDVQISAGNFDPEVLAKNEELKKEEEERLAAEADALKKAEAEKENAAKTVESTENNSSTTGFAKSGEKSSQSTRVNRQPSRRNVTPTTIPQTNQPPRASAYPAENLPILPFGIFQPFGQSL